MNQVVFYDHHTLYVRTGVAHKKQLEHSIHEVLERLKIPCRYKVNHIVDKNNFYTGYAFVWFSNPRIYYILTGRNEDGSDRVKHVIDPVGSNRTFDNTYLIYHK